MTAKKQTPAPESSPQWVEPQAGGCYQRDPITGALTAAAPATNAPAVPAATPPNTTPNTTQE